MFFIVYLLVGLIVGLLAGLFGIGSGAVMVPILVLCLKWQGFAPDMQMHIALGTSLACITLTSISSAWAHHRVKAVRWHLVKWLAPGMVVGAWLGSATASSLKGTQLQLMFGLFLWVIAVQMMFGWQPRAVSNTPGKVGLGFAGGIIGATSALFGIGGGSLTVPFLTACRVRVQEAVATSAACGFPIAISGAAAYAFHGWNFTGLPPYSAGFVYLPALLGISIGSLPCTRVGAMLAHRLPAKQLKRGFACYLLVVGALLLVEIYPR